MKPSRGTRVCVLVAVGALVVITPAATSSAPHSTAVGRGPFGASPPPPRRTATKANRLSTPASETQAKSAHTFPAKQYSRSPSTAATTTALTGVKDLSTISVRNACPGPAPGRATCLAQALTNDSTGQLLRLKPKASPPSQPLATSPALTLTPSPPSPALEPEGVPAPSVGSPGYLQQAYDLMGLSATAGSGDTIAVVDAYGYEGAESDLATYRSYFVGVQGVDAC